MPPALKTFNFKLPGVSNTALPTTVRVNLYGRSNTPHLCTVWLNDKIEFGEARWNGEIEYQIHNQDIPQSFLNEGRNAIRITNPGTPESPIDIVLLNWLQIDYWRDFKAEADVLPFAITPFPDATGTASSSFEVELKNFTLPDIEIYGIDGTRYVGVSALVDESVPGTYRVFFRSTQIRPQGSKRSYDPIHCTYREPIPKTDNLGRHSIRNCTAHTTPRTTSSLHITTSFRTFSHLLTIAPNKDCARKSSMSKTSMMNLTTVYSILRLSVNSSITPITIGSPRLRLMSFS